MSTLAVVLAASMLLWAAVAMAVTVTVSWDANTESDLAGYNIYIGESSGTYTGAVDVGNATEFTWNNLQDGVTYFFAVTAYDFSGNESDFSAEVSVTLSGNGDTNPPELIDVVVRGETQLDVVFSEVVDQTSAQSALNYTISNGVQVLGAVLDANATVVHLITTAHERGVTYVLSVSNVKDLDGNEISAGSSKSYQLSGGNDDTTPPQVNSVAVVDLTHIDVVFNERLDATSAQRRSNYEISNGVQVLQATLSSNGQVVQLTTTSHQNETSYTLTVNDVQDEAGNTIASNSSVTYQTPAAGDNQPPTLVSVSVNGTTQIDVNFSEPVEQSTAENKSNYAINNGISVLGAILDANLTTVHLITTAHQQGDTYSLTVNNVRDRAQDPNIIAANSRISYTMIEDPISDPQDIFNPQTFALFQNYPNPFNPETEIRFFLDKQRTVELKVYNPLGQLIKSLVKEDLAAGFHTVVWDGTNEDKMQAPSGVYIYSLEVKREQAKGDMLVNVSLERRVKKMTLIR